MVVGVLKEIKEGEYRVAIVPAIVEYLARDGHTHPVYIEEGVVHYCVANMPGAVAGTSTHALTNATGRYILELTNKGWRQAISESPALAKGLNIAEGKVVLPQVAGLFGYKQYDIASFRTQ